MWISRRIFFFSHRTNWHLPLEFLLNTLLVELQCEICAGGENQFLLSGRRQSWIVQWEEVNYFATPLPSPTCFNTLLQETYLLQISCFPVFPCWLTAVFKRSSLSEAFSDATGVPLNIRSYLIIMSSCVSCNLISKTLKCSDEDER